MGGHRGDLAPDRRRPVERPGGCACSARPGSGSRRGGWSTCCCAPGPKGDLLRPAPRRAQPRRSCARTRTGSSSPSTWPRACSREQIRHRRRRVRLDPPEIVAEAERLRRRATAHDPDFPLRLIGLRELRSHNSWMHNAAAADARRAQPRRPHPPRRRRGGRDRGRRRAAGSAPRTARSRLAALRHRRGQARARSRSRTAGATAAAGSVANAAGGANVNLLASSDPDDLERLAGMAHLNGIPVRLERVGAAADAERRRAAADAAPAPARDFPI